MIGAFKQRRSNMNQSLRTVGIISPGDMGHVVGQVLTQHGLRVVTSLAGRSARTRTLAAKAGIEDIGGYRELVQAADIVLSILVPAEAVAAAEQIADAVAATGANLTFVDCNAIAPQTVQQIEQITTAAGCRFVDASIIGPPPRNFEATRFYASAKDAADFARLTHHGLNILVLDGPAGQASALKMCYAALTKGFTALCTELLTAAEALGVAGALADEFELSQTHSLRQMNRSLPGMPPKAHRWVGEMEEIAQTFAHVGLTPHIFTGAADMYRLVSETSLADRTPEDATPPPTAQEIAATLARHLANRPT
jgi:3-hydroxyisobutyrate dehydrogenase-like beta-hydroxyacid dehydrogenase